MASTMLVRGGASPADVLDRRKAEVDRLPLPLPILHELVFFTATYYTPLTSTFDPCTAYMTSRSPIL